MKVSNERQSDREPALPPQAAASQNQVPVPFAAIPADAWQEVDRRIRSLLANGLSPSRVFRLLKLRQRFGIRVRAIHRCYQPLAAAGSLPADGLEHRASRPHATGAPATQRLTGHPLADDAVAAPAVPASPAVAAVAVPLSTQDSAPSTAVAVPPGRSPATGEFVETLSRRFLDRLAQAIDDPDLSHDQLSRLANCFARQRQALTRAQAQKIVASRYIHERIQFKKKEKASKPRMMTMTERVRRIYGLDRPEMANMWVKIPDDEYSPEQERQLRAKGVIK